MRTYISKDFSKRFAPDPAHDYMEEYLNTKSEFNYRRMLGWLDCEHLQTDMKRIERENMIVKYGVNSAIVRSMLYGLFQRSEDFNLVFSEDDLTAMRQAMRQGSPGENESIGTDVISAADPSGGGDGQILYIRVGTKIILQDDYNSGSGIKQAKYWIPLLRELEIKPWQFYIDSTGLGSEVASYIEDDLMFRGINRIVANQLPRFKHEFKDKYTETLFFIKELLTAGVLNLKYNEKLLKQMRCRRFIEMDGRRVKAEDKKVHRKREKCSPDELDDLVYVFWDFDRSLLDIHVESGLSKPNENEPTKMEREAASGSTAFEGMNRLSKVRDARATDPRLQKLRIGR